MNAIPDGFEAIQDNSVPDGFEEVTTTQPGIIAQAGKDVGNILKYNASKVGAGINAGIANINEFVGAPSDMFRDNQKYYQDSAQNADIALNKTYGEDGIMKTIAKEAGNPLNYAGGGIKTLMGIVGADTANEIATKGNGSGIDLNDVSKVADNMSVGLVAGKALDKLFNMNTKRALLGDDVRSPQEIAKLKALADEHGITLTPASSTGSANLAKLEHSINDGVAGGLGMRQALNAERETADNAIMKTLEDMGANGSNTIAGENLRLSTQKVIDSEKQYFHNTFGKLFAKYGNEPVFSITGVKDVASELVKQAETIPLIKNSTAYRDSKAILESADDLTWSDWSKLRTHLGGLTQDATVTGKASTGAYKNMYAQLENDLKRSVSRTGDTDTLNKYNKAIDEYKVFKKDFEGKSGGAQFVRSLVEDKVRPEAVGSLINNSTLKAKGALNAGGINLNTGIPVAKTASATDVMQSSLSKTDDSLWLPSFLKYSDREGFKTVANADNYKVDKASKVLFDADDVIPSRYLEPTPSTSGIEISELQEIAKSIVAKDRHKNNSKTAQYNMLNALKVMSPIEVGKYIIKDVGISVGYRSKLFSNWLEKGILSKSDYTSLMKIKTPVHRSVRTGAINSLFEEPKREDAKTKIGL